MFQEFAALTLNAVFPKLVLTFGTWTTSLSLVEKDPEFKCDRGVIYDGSCPVSVLKINRKQ